MRRMLNRVLSIGIQHLPPRILHMPWTCLREVEIGRNRRSLPLSELLVLAEESGASAEPDLVARIPRNFRRGANCLLQAP